MKMKMEVARFECNDVMTASIMISGLGDGDPSNNVITYNGISYDALPVDVRTEVGKIDLPTGVGGTPTAQGVSKMWYHLGDDSNPQFSYFNGTWRRVEGNWLKDITQ